MKFAVTLPLVNRLHVDIAIVHSHICYQGCWKTESCEKCCRRWFQKKLFFWCTDLGSINWYRDHTSANCGSPNLRRQRHCGEQSTFHSWKISPLT